MGTAQAKFASDPKPSGALIAFHIRTFGTTARRLRDGLSHPKTQAQNCNLTVKCWRLVRPESPQALTIWAIPFTAPITLCGEAERL